MRRAQASQAEDLGEALQVAMLEASGELGYRNVSVRHVLERSERSRARFYQLFESKADCYLKAYETEIERLCAELLAAASAAGSWRGGLRASLVALARFASERTMLAKGLLVEVHVAGEPAGRKRREMIERLTRAIDSARRENESRHSPPPITAEFMVFTIEGAVVTALAKGEPEAFSDALPGLARIVVGPFFGPEAGRAEMEALRRS